MKPWTLHGGDALEIARGFPSDTFDGMLCDPPYGWAFMGHRWDYDVPSVETFAEYLRVLKPGAYALVACGTRTQHRMAVNLEDAGFEIRDVITWLYSQGFPKSHDLGKALDRAAGAERDVVGVKSVGSGNRRGPGFRHAGAAEGVPVTAPATEDARTWDGYGTALKPAVEFYTLVRKPTGLTYAENVLAHGVGALNIAGARVPFRGAEDEREAKSKNRHTLYDEAPRVHTVFNQDHRKRTDWSPEGRFPSNLILDDGAAALLDRQSGESASRKGKPRASAQPGEGWGMTATGAEYDDFGGASRFFYCAKADRTERDAGLTAFEKRPLYWSSGSQNPGAFQSPGTERAARNDHPNVKPLDLCRYLATLLLPPRRDTPRRLVVPFAGSGSEMIGALLAG